MEAPAKNKRAGKWVMQIEGYKAFLPAPLPPVPSLNMDQELIALLTSATHNVGQLSMLTLSAYGMKAYSLTDFTVAAATVAFPLHPGECQGNFPMPR